MANCALIATPVGPPFAENYSSNGSLSQAVTDELERFNVGGAGKPRGESADQRSIPSPGGDGI
jgi:hypothetical protein